MKFWRVTRAVLRRDILAEWRRKEIFITIAMFGLLTVVTFVFAFDPARHAREEILPGSLWTAIFFAGMLGLNRSASKDASDGGLDALISSPADRGALYLGKLASHALFMLVGEAVILVFVIAWFDLDGRHLRWPLFALLLLGTAGFLAVGTIFAVVGQKSRLREVMLPVLLIPVLTPLILAVVEGTAIVLTPGGDRGLQAWMQLAIGFDVLFVAAAFLLYGFVLED